MAENNIQLLPATRKEVRIKKPISIKGLVFPALILMAVLTAYFGLTFYKNSILNKISSIDQEIISIENDRDKELEKELLAIDKQLATVNSVIANHITWTKGFDRFQSLINPQVQVKSFSANTTIGKITFSAVATNYTTVAKQIAAFFSEETFKKVDVGKIGLLQTDQVEFSAEITFDNPFLK
ncbi:MAG: hypothetical protein Q8Q06_01525 [bacterium]|nr:hypothetical protein [bacterium]